MDRTFPLLMLVASLAAPFPVQAAPTLTLSTSSLQSDVDAVLTHTITGIAVGETVTVERFADLNENGAIDSGEPSLRTFVSSVCCARWTGEWPWADGVLFPGAITWLHLVDGQDDQDLRHLADRADTPMWPLRRVQDRSVQPALVRAS